MERPLRDEDVATALSRAAMRVLGSVALTARLPGGVVLVVPRPDLVGDNAPGRSRTLRVVVAPAAERVDRRGPPV